MKKLSLQVIKEIDLRDFGEITVFTGDINGDGKIELVFPQGEDGPDPCPATGFYPHGKTIRCVTAVNLDGEILWQTGTPMGSGIRKYHGRGPVLVRDLNGDGKAEVTYVTAVDNNRFMLRQLAGADGSLIAETETWAAYDIIPANLRGLDSKRDFIVGDGLRLVFAYDETLVPLWKWHRYYGGGHHHYAEDIEGKGCDDVYIGVGRYNAAGERIWWRPDLDGVIEQMPCCPHMDKIEVHRFFGESDEWQALWIGGHDVACVKALDGELLWRLPGEHIHRYTLGRFDPQSHDTLIYVSERDVTGPSWLLEPSGKVLWKKDLGPGQPITLHGAGENNSDLLIICAPSPGEIPYVMSHTGEKLAELSFCAPQIELSESGKRGDSGYGFHFKAVDIDNDGIDELLVYNRSRMMVVKADNV